MYFLDSLTELLNREARGVAQQGIYLNQLRSLDMPLPPKDEQQKIVEILEDQLSRLEASVLLADTIELQSYVLRRSLLKAALIGQLTKEVASV
jgi:type I restriction enzyme S subunit